MTTPPELREVRDNFINNYHDAIAWSLSLKPGMVPLGLGKQRRTQDAVKRAARSSR